MTDITVDVRAWYPEIQYWNHNYLIHSTKLETELSELRHIVLLIMEAGVPQ